MSSDWVRLHRSLLDSSVFDDEFLLKMWVWCMLKANYKERLFKGQVVKRGQFITGRSRGSEDLGCSQSRWMRGIDKLVDLGCITTEANSKWTTVSICNYETYQSDDDDDRTASGQREIQPADSQRTAGDTQEKELKNNIDIDVGVPINFETLKSLADLIGDVPDSDPDQRIADRIWVYKVEVLKRRGDIDTDVLSQISESSLRHRSRNGRKRNHSPMAYFHGSLKKHFQKRGINFNQLLSQIPEPDWIRNNGST